LDASGSVSPANYLRYLMETAWDWGDAVGLGVKDSQTLDLFWVIRETEIRFLRPLRHHDSRRGQLTVYGHDSLRRFSRGGVPHRWGAGGS
jgi:acyl-CoA thioesterase FadM